MWACPEKVDTPEPVLDGLIIVSTFSGQAQLDTYSATANVAAVYDFSLDRDRQGRITAKTETIEGATTYWECTYHPQRGWLTEVKRDGVVVESYAYDDNGNRTFWDDSWGSGTATYDDQDRMLTAGARSPAPQGLFGHLAVGIWKAAWLD